MTISLAEEVKSGEREEERRPFGKVNDYPMAGNELRCAGVTIVRRGIRTENLQGW